MAPRSIAKIFSAELVGIDAKIIEVEVDMNVGLHSFTIVGLADKAVNEARERVNSALKNSGYKPPNRQNRKITVNLAPADLRKAGARYDLAIAVGYLLAAKQIAPFAGAKKCFIGELSLEGSVRSVEGALSVAETAHKFGFTELFLPEANACEATLIEGISVFPVRDLSETIAHLEGRAIIEPLARRALSEPRPDVDAHATERADFGLIIGQENAKRALTIAASGAHHLLMVGPPGVGKSMLAHGLAGILPNLASREAIEAMKIWGAAGLGPRKCPWERPFRAPHQTASTLALVGGGQEPHPGEASLAHGGILFLDEFPEFPRPALEALREPMESGLIRIARAKQSLVFPAKFILIAAMNPCPCGYYGDPEHECKCAAYEVIRYQRKISGPLLDRIDIQIKVGRVRIGELTKEGPVRSQSREIRAKVESARKMQAERFKNSNTTANGGMSSREVREMVQLGPDARRFIDTIEGSKLSPRGYYRVLKVARTIADLEQREKISAEDLAEAFGYRMKFPSS